LNGSPYLSSEDSELLRAAMAGRSGGSVLEIGAGNGGNLVSMTGRFGLIVGTDLVRPGMDDWAGAPASFVLADRASCFRDETFDLVVFNPPYVRGEGYQDVAVDAGSRGEAPLGFLAEALRVVKASGTVLMLLSSESPVEEAATAACEAKGFGLVPVASKRLFYEELTVYSASRVDFSGDYSDTSAVSLLHQVPASPA